MRRAPAVQLPRRTISPRQADDSVPSLATRPTAPVPALAERFVASAVDSRRIRMPVIAWPGLLAARFLASIDLRRLNFGFSPCA